MEEVFTLGIDVGAAAAKCVVVRGGHTVAGHAVVPAGIGTSGPERALKTALESAGLTLADVVCTVATGYGRKAITCAESTVSELSCHALGIHAQFPQAATGLDIGGQDIKVFQIGQAGELLGFLMNDKCAAGTGRFLEVMAHVLERNVQEMAALGQGVCDPVQISSTCTVFAESEVISQLAAGTDIRRLAAGIHVSVATRAASLARRLGIQPPLVMTGGVAQNGGVVEALEQTLGIPVLCAPLAQLNGAYGAALWAWRNWKRRSEEA